MNLTHALLAFVIGIAQVVQIVSVSHVNDANPIPQRRRHLLGEGFECTVYIKVIDYEDREGDEVFSCELSAETLTEMAKANGAAARSAGSGVILPPFAVSEMVDIEGLRTDKQGFENEGHISGATTMRFSMGGYIEQRKEGLKLVVSQETNVQLEDLSERDDRHYLNRRRSRGLRRDLAASTGGLDTLVVRVIDSNNVQPTSNAAKLKDDIFDDDVSLNTHYRRCSHGKLWMNNKGITNVNVNILANSGYSAMEDAAREAAGDLGQYDLVMFCLPPGTGSWVAYAYINGRDSVYNDEWCGYVSAQMHEVGHNLGLAHSGEGDEQYGDQSGMMGYSYGLDDGPKMCFNAAKNYQLGWFKKQQADYNPIDKNNDPAPKKFVLNGVDDANDSNPGKLIALRLVSDGIGDYYVGYNRASGMNTGTLEAKNEVVIIKKVSGGPNQVGKSLRVASLKSNEEVTIESWNGSIFDVTIRVIGNIGSSITDANIQISTSAGYPTESPTSSCGGVNRFRVELKIDPFGLETSWRLTEKETGNVFVSSGRKYEGLRQYSEPRDTTGESAYCLPPATKFVFEIFDDYGDGICCAYEDKGYYRLFLDEEDVGSGGEFENVASHEFTTSGEPELPPPPPDGGPNCEDVGSKFLVGKKKRRCKWVDKGGRWKNKNRKKVKRRCNKKTVWQNVTKKVRDLCPERCADFIPNPNPCSN